MSSTGEFDRQLGGSETIEEDGIFGDATDGGSVEAQSHTPPTDSSRRSSASQQSESASSVVPKQAPPLLPMSRSAAAAAAAAASASSGVRHQVEKQQRRKASLGLAAAASGSLPASVFTLGHVKKIFGPHPKQQQQQQQQQRRASSGSSGLERPADTEPLQRRLSRLSVDTLPAVFLAKSLGEAPADGLFGVDSVRRPVEALVGAAGKRKAKTGRPLPIAQLTVLPQGVSVRPHPQSEGGQVTRDFHAIDSVSYAVMDPARPRVFCLVVAASAAAAAAAPKPPVCHAFLCNSADTAYRLVLAVTFAFESSAAAASGGGGGGNGADAVEFGNA